MAIERSKRKPSCPALKMTVESNLAMMREVRGPTLLPDRMETTRDSDDRPKKGGDFFAVEDYESVFDA